MRVKKKTLIEALNELPNDWFYIPDDVMSEIREHYKADKQSEKEGFCLCPQWKLKCQGPVNGKCPTGN